MGFWLMPELPSQTFLFTFEREEDYGEIAATAQQMILNRVIHNLPVLGPGHTDLMSNNYLRKKDLFDDKGPVPKEVWRKAMKDKSILGGCAWILYGSSSASIPSRHLLHRLSMLTNRIQGISTVPRP